MYLLALEFNDLKDLFQVKHYAIPTHNFIFHFSLLSDTLPASPFLRSAYIRLWVF